MADAYWRYNDSRQHHQPPPPHSIPTLVGKRPRTDYGRPKGNLWQIERCGPFSLDYIEYIPSGHELANYYPRNDDRGALSRDTESIGASYDRYLRSAPVQSYGGGQSARPISEGVAGRPIDDRRMMGVESIDRGPIVKDRSLGFGSGRSEVSLPPDASSTLFVEGLPSDCTRREVSHIFRPFVGYKEVRLVNKESRHPGGEPLVLCFVDFLSPAHAATAMDALQGYKFDEHDRDAVHLRLQFARYPGARSGGGHRGKR